MKDFIKNLDWFDWVFWAILIATCLLLISIIFTYVDESMADINDGYCIIENKYKKHAYIRTDYIVIDNALAPVTHYSPEKFILTLRVGEKAQEVEVPEKYFAQYSIGESMCCSYGITPIFKNLVIYNFRPCNKNH